MTAPKPDPAALLADAYASKNMTVDDYAASFDSFIAGYRAALTPQALAGDEAVLCEFEEALCEYTHSSANADAEQRARFKKARAAVLARMAVPQGYALVPREPTEDMLRAGGLWASGYAAMLAAAPEVK